jgi:hypothetical protein
VPRLPAVIIYQTCSVVIFAAPLYSVAEDQEAAQVQRVVVRQLGMNSNEIGELGLWRLGL